MPLTSSTPRLGGWLLLPLAWLILTLLTSALVVIMYIGALFNPEWRELLFSHDHAFLLQWDYRWQHRWRSGVTAHGSRGFSVCARAVCRVITLSGCC